MLLTCGVTVGLCTQARAGAGDGIRITEGALLTPYAEAKVVYDDNVLIAADGEEKSDSSLFGKVGFDLVGESEDANMQANAWASTTAYQDMDEQDHDDYGLSTTLGFGNRDQLFVGIGGSYSDVQGLEYSASAIEHTKTATAKAAVGKNMTDKVDLDIGYDYSMSDYTNLEYPEKDYLEEPSRDWSQHKAMVELAYQVTDKSAALINGSVGTQSSDSNANDADFYQVHAGLKTKNTDKITGRVSAGYREQMIDPLDPNADDTISGGTFEVAADWQCSERVTLQVAGQNNILPSRYYDESYAWETVIKAGIIWNIGTTLTANIEGLYRQWEEDNQVPDPRDDILKDKTIETVTGIVRLTYQTPAKFLAVYAEGRYEDSTSDFEFEDYQQMLAIAGLRLCY